MDKFRTKTSKVRETVVDSKENKKEQILKVASIVFAKHGFNKTTLDDIGEQVGMKKNSLYHYFENKEDIFLEIIGMDAEEYFNNLEKELAGEINSSEKLKRFVLVTTGFWKEKANFYNLVTSVKIEMVNRISDFYDVSITKQKKLINNILAEGVRSDEFVDHDTMQLAEDLIDMFVSIERWEFNRQKKSYFNEDYFNENKRKKMNLLNLIVKGLKKTK